MINSTILQRSAIILALLTAFGILIHDTKMDKATSMLFAVPAALATLGAIPHLANEGHNHIERGAFGKASRDAHNGTPRIQPRNDHKKYALQKRVSRGVHAFDGYYQPLGEL